MTPEVGWRDPRIHGPGYRPSTRTRASGAGHEEDADVSDQDKGSQGQLFSDAAVGAPAYDEVDTDLVGYRGPTACAAERNSTSTEGLCRFTGAPSRTRAT